MRGMARLLFVAALAVVGFVVAIASFKEVPASECQAEAIEDSSYKVAIEPSPPDVNVTTYTLRVTQRGERVAGAEVCLRADMGGAGNMSGMGTSGLADEVRPGEYEINIRFEMAGHWQGHSLIRESGQTIEVPIQMEVQ